MYIASGATGRNEGAGVGIFASCTRMEGPEDFADVAVYLGDASGKVDHDACAQME